MTLVDQFGTHNWRVRIDSLHCVGSLRLGIGWGCATGPNPSFPLFDGDAIANGSQVLLTSTAYGNGYKCLSDGGPDLLPDGGWRQYQLVGSFSDAEHFAGQIVGCGAPLVITLELADASTP